MPFYIYKTTNKINQKYYIGVSNGNKSHYLGSGTALLKAIKLYGKENFQKEIIEQYNTELEAFKREAEIVNEAFVKDRNTYNMKIGGKGGVGQKKSAKHRKNISLSIKKLYQLGFSNMSGRPPAMNSNELFNIVSLYGFKGSANKLKLSLDQVKCRYYRYKKKLQAGMV